MEEYLRKDFGKILKSAGLEARRWMKNTDSDVCRVYDRSLEGLELTVDIYGRYARVMDYGDGERSEEEITEILDTVSRFLYIERDKIIWKERRKREGREQHGTEEGECPVVVRERGLEFECELRKYADTGLFLDMAETREIVKGISRNQRVLNLFSYTSSFSVYAAQGGALSVESVDLSNVYISWSRRNLERNGFLSEEKYKTVAMDARSFLEMAVEEGRTYDIVIFDPPAFSNSHKAEDFDVQKDYIPFLAAIWKILGDGGVVFFSENLSGFRFEKKKLDPWFEIRELTTEVSAMNFSRKRRSCRVWEMAKKARKTKRNYSSEAKEEKKEMDEEMKEMEAPERLVLDESAANEKKAEKRVKASPRVFSFEDGEEKARTDEEDSFRKKNSPRRDGERRSERRFGDDRRDDRRDRRDERRFDRRDDRRDDRRFDRRDDRRDDRRFDRRDDRRDDRRFDRRDDRNFDRRDYGRYSDRSERSYERHSDWRDGSYGERRGERSDRFSKTRDDSFSRRDGGRYSDVDRYGREERGYSKYASDSRTFSGRRDSEGRRDNYKRDSYPSRDRRYQSDRDWDNDTSRMYREGRRDSGREERRSEGRKKSAPKPFGYDSFMENKNREGATAFWLQGQISSEEND